MIISSYRHIDFFETSRYEDESSYLTMLNEANHLIDLNNNETSSEKNNNKSMDNCAKNEMMSFGNKVHDPSFFFDLITKQLKYTTSYSYWSSILYHLLAVTGSYLIFYKYSYIIQLLFS